MLRMSSEVYFEMVGHCLGGLPDEACGLLAGDADTGDAKVCYPTRNAAASARVYTVDPKEHLQADRDAERRHLEIIGVFHSHTHTDAYPSPTDIEQAPDPGWHYVVVSLRDLRPVLRSYSIHDGQVDEESVVVAPDHGVLSARLAS
jgi:[CysO sulfur-carrier protein]-S-L-cysteine hydrolase